MEDETLLYWLINKLIFFWLIYWVYSLLFFFMPIYHIQNKFRPNAKRHEGIWSIAHRGGSREGMENTISTFRKAVQKNCQILEMDIQLTKDKHPVVFHDRDMERLWGRKSKIQECNYADLSPLLENIDLHFANFEYKSNKTDDRKIPLLEDVMKEFPDVPFNMELKQDNDDIKREVLKLIKKYRRESITIWGSVNEEHCLQLKKMAPEIPTFCPEATIKRILFYLLIGYLPFYRIPHDTFQVPFINQDYIDYKIKYSGSSLGLSIYLFGLKIFKLIAKPIFYHLRNRRIFVFYYAINNRKDFKVAIDKGIDGIITDSPELLVNHITKKQN